MRPKKRELHELRSQKLNVSYFWYEDYIVVIIEFLTLFYQAVKFFFIVQYLLAELKSQVEAAVGKIPLSLHNYAAVLRDIT